MWIDRKAYDNLITENAQLRGANREQARSIASLQASHDWLMVRTTQLEKERAQLLHNFMGIKVEVPEVVRVPTAPASRDVAGAAALASAVAPYFTDMGDDEALKQGVGWNEEGEVIYKKS